MRRYQHVGMIFWAVAMAACGSDEKSQSSPVFVAMNPDISMDGSSPVDDAGINEQMEADQRVAADSMPDAAMVDEPDAASQNDMAPNDNMVERPDLPMGPNDSLAQAACALIDAAADEVLAVAVEGDAGQVLLTPQRNRTYSVTIPDTGVGFVTLEVPDWAVTIGAFLNFQQRLTVLDPMQVTEVVVPLSWNGACTDSDITDQRLHYHSWGSFTLRLEGEA
ncbi:MAG: hypothetical protein ACON3Z_18510, partial [Bradymonadia bacterium]